MIFSINKKFPKKNKKIITEYLMKVIKRFHYEYEANVTYLNDL